MSANSCSFVYAYESIKWQYKDPVNLWLVQVQGSHCLNKKMGIYDSNEGDFDDDGDIDVDALLIKVKE